MTDTYLSELAGRTVLVTGGAGLIGSRVTAQLRKLGAHPRVLCALDPYPPHTYRDVFDVDLDSPDAIEGSVTDRAAVARAVDGADYVIHAAALADVAACTRHPHNALAANITGTQTVLDAAAASDQLRRFVFVSSASVYGNGEPDNSPRCAELRSMRQLLESVYGQAPTLFTEESPLRPVSVYGSTKAWGETQTRLILSAVGVSHTVVRCFSVYGEPQIVKQNSHSWMVAWFAARAALGLPLHLHGGGRQIRDLVHVDDVAAATVRSLVAPRAHNETINIGTGTPISVRTVAGLIAEHFPGTQLLETPMPPGDPLGGYASPHRLAATLEWKPSITVAEGVARYVRWLGRTPDAVPYWLRSEQAAAF
ncbi:NAD-dependent epimerase/dehydratase family protein [Streptomyces sp. NBC_01795]|uniref:NAD-dependent epimerase/dehydratase family protein n=1 Tax=Streptomyces sp. NBC_01795 TaxID=2975943 RepID=UPI002DDB3FD3|nr:NAD-dependent epimerase/dehydratase family protein [Streptomyces sp. NBC_01795]WSA95512.1 NAD-dependent epimerase/dehydratase family protein [Streptomyces sp. NBC_01795]